MYEQKEETKSILYKRLGPRPSEIELAEWRAQWESHMRGNASIGDVAQPEKNSVINEGQIKHSSAPTTSQVTISEQSSKVVEATTKQTNSPVASNPQLVREDISNIVGTYWKDNDRNVVFDLFIGEDNSTLLFKEHGGNANAVTWLKDSESFVAKWTTADYGGAVSEDGTKYLKPYGVFEITLDNNVVERTEHDTKKIVFQKEKYVKMSSISELPVLNENAQRDLAVKASFLRAWNDYWTHCKGSDELWPLKQKCYN